MTPKCCLDPKCLQRLIYERLHLIAVFWNRSRVLWYNQWIWSIDGFITEQAIGRYWKLEDGLDWKKEAGKGMLLRDMSYPHPPHPPHLCFLEVIRKTVVFYNALPWYLSFTLGLWSAIEPADWELKSWEKWDLSYFHLLFPGILYCHSGKKLTNSHPHIHAVWSLSSILNLLLECKRPLLWVRLPTSGQTSIMSIANHCQRIK